MTLTKIALATAAALALSAALIFQRTTAPPSLPPAAVVKAVRTETLAQMPFDHPSWEPDEATKKKALMRAYHANGDQMCCGFHYVDDNSKLEGVVSDGKFNALDQAAMPPSPFKDPPDWAVPKPEPKGHGRTRLAHRNMDDVCAKYGMHKVNYKDKWRCRK